MKPEPLAKSLAMILAALALNPGCSRAPAPAAAHNRAPAQAAPLAMLLVPQAGSGDLENQIRRCQAQLRAGPVTDPTLERLGWLFVAKARASFDPGYYKLAEQAALALELNHPGSPEGLLLRGHVFDNLHRFQEAEAIARELTARRGLPADFGLLSDALMEQGKLNGAVEACQQMADLKPDLQAWVRAAHLRWLKGDLAGATELMSRSVRAVSPRDADTVAWSLSRLGAYQFQAGAFDQADQRCSEALAARPDYPPALLLRGRILLAQQRAIQGVPILQRAAQLVPLPEYQWTLAEALAAAGQSSAAQAVAADLRRTGAQSDPRTFALFLATRREEPDLASRLARLELENRGDVFTHDALAWALCAQGETKAAGEQMKLALAEGTRDARLFLHAAVITAQAGEPQQSAGWLEKVHTLQHLLLPSERDQLARLPGSTGMSAHSRFPAAPGEWAGTEPQEPQTN